jgi:anthranilate phosphoribosyltransferase
MIRGILQKLLAGHELTQAEAERLMDEVMAGRLDPACLGAVLAALRLRGVTAAELGGFALSLRAHAVPVISRNGDTAVDTCGTGGDLRGTFNISTGAALVTAAAGATVAKHGNRAATSRCGSADVLEALGVRIDLGPDSLGRLIDEVGIAFLFAPRHHPAMRHAGPVRSALGVRTVFNLLGPLANPAGVRRQLLGVYAPELTGLMAGALRCLGAERALVVHGRDGQDEVSLTGETTVVDLREGELQSGVLHPEDVGLARCAASDLAGADVETNARLLTEVLDGRPGPRADAVLLNAAFALVAAGVCEDPREGCARARSAVASGAARRLLDRLREATQDLATGETAANGGEAAGAGKVAAAAGSGAPLITPADTRPCAGENEP